MLEERDRLLVAFSPGFVALPHALLFGWRPFAGSDRRVLRREQTCGLAQAGMAPRQAPLQRFPRIGEQMKAVGNLF
ncbi:MAG TPA: hypothetical protein VF808_05260, partial [Ktedonobacterales bacterium]